MNKIAGMLLFLAGSIILMGIVTAEILYPGYNVSFDMISTLASSPPPQDVVREPSAGIFTLSMLVAGFLLLIAAISFFKEKSVRILGIGLGTLGLGAAGVGFFPASTGAFHVFFAFVTFVSGGISAIISYKATRAPFSLFSVILGSVTLFFLGIGILDAQAVVPLLGKGGTERFVAYPLIIWIISFGSYCMAKTK